MGHSDAVDRGDRAAHELCYQADGGVTRAEYLSAVSESLLGLVGGDLVMWNSVSLADPAVEVVLHPVAGREAGTLARQLADVLGEHPMMPSYLGERPDGLPAPRRLSDVATRSELERNRAYVDVLRPSGARHQLTVVASPITPQATRGWAISRAGADFPDDAVEAVRVMQPVLAVLDRSHEGWSLASAGGAAAAERLGLTARELQVLRLVAEGLTSHVIGRRLRISSRTVDKHRESLHRKLERHDRLALVRRAQELGIVPGAGTRRS